MPKKLAGSKEAGIPKKLAGSKESLQRGSATGGRAATVGAQSLDLKDPSDRALHLVSEIISQKLWNVLTVLISILTYSHGDPIAPSLFYYPR